jgi:hypothetical protein
MKQITFDWSAGKLTVLIGDADKPVYYPSTEALIQSLTEPHRIVCEATFESFNIEQRKRVIELAKAGGHEFLTLPNRQTGRYRRFLGYEDKTDEIDVAVLRSQSIDKPERLKVPNVRELDDERVTDLKAANHELMILRRTLNIVPNKSKLGFKTVSAKDYYADDIIRLLPEFKTLTPTQQLALGSAGKYSKTLVAAAAKATKFSESRGDFEHYAGLFAHGYPSQIRSDFMHWRFRFAAKHGVTLSDFRRECRWLYHQLKKHKSSL